ncbi:hypothetical protein, partial [Salmonella enterica]|nr:malate synthase A [Salmonella enterica]
WLKAGDLHLDDGTPIDWVLFERALLPLPARLREAGVPGADRIDEAIALLEDLVRADTLADFLTLPAYARID